MKAKQMICFAGIAGAALLGAMSLSAPAYSQAKAGSNVVAAATTVSDDRMAYEKDVNAELAAIETQMKDLHAKKQGKKLQPQWTALKAQWSKTRKASDAEWKVAKVEFTQHLANFKKKLHAVSKQ